MNAIRRRCFALLAVAGTMLLVACASWTGHAPESRNWERSRQLVLVLSADWNADHGTLHRYERAGDAWRAVGEAQPVMIGKSGSAWGLGLHAAGQRGPRKREGDGRSPAGIFAIGEAFGYAPSTTTALPYAPMLGSSYCVDVSGSPFYNRIVDAQVVGADAVAQATEPMRRDLHADGDQRYRLGFVIEHNTQARPMGGSCIFAHLWKSPSDATTGCTAMAADTMDALLRWLRPDAQPILVLMPMEEYSRLHARWGLPSQTSID